MEASIQSLRDRLDAFLYELGSVHYRFGAGLSGSLPIAELFAAYPEFGRAESFAR